MLCGVRCVLYRPTTTPPTWLGSVAVGRWTRDQEVTGSTPTTALFGQQPWASCSHLMCLCSLSSIIWYLARAFMLKAPYCWQQHGVQWTRGYCRVVLQWSSDCIELRYKSSALLFTFYHRTFLTVSMFHFLSSSINTCSCRVCIKEWLTGRPFYTQLSYRIIFVSIICWSLLNVTLWYCSYYSKPLAFDFLQVDADIEVVVFVDKLYAQILQTKPLVSVTMQWICHREQIKSLRMLIMSLMTWTKTFCQKSVNCRICLIMEWLQLQTLVITACTAWFNCCGSWQL